MDMGENTTSLVELISGLVVPKLLGIWKCLNTLLPLIFSCDLLTVTKYHHPPRLTSDLTVGALNVCQSKFDFPLSELWRVWTVHVGPFHSCCSLLCVLKNLLSLTNRAKYCFPQSVFLWCKI